MRVLLVPALAFLTGSACSSSGGRPDGSTELDAAGDLPPGPAADADQAIDTWEPQGPRCLYKPVTLSPVGDGTPCAFVNALPPEYWSGAYPTSVQVLLNGVMLTGPLVDGSTGDGWVYGQTKATIVLVGGACDTVISNPQTTVVQITCTVTFGGGP